MPLSRAIAFQRLACGIILLLGSNMAPLAYAAGDANAELGWRQASQYLFQESYKRFRTLAKTRGPELRNVRLGEALNLLNLQPKTQGNIQQAANIFSSLAGENPSDEIGITAQYYLARVEQIHRSKPNYALAAKYYRNLIEQYPRHRMAQLAFVKWGMLQIYAPIETGERLLRLRSLEKEASMLTDPTAIRESHMLLADAFSRFVEHGEDSLRHLIEAERIGFSSQRMKANALVRIGETALQLGKPDIASHYYRKFIKEFPRDDRNYTVRQRLESIQKEGER